MTANSFHIFLRLLPPYPPTTSNQSSKDVWNTRVHWSDQCPADCSNRQHDKRHIWTGLHLNTLWSWDPSIGICCFTSNCDLLWFVENPKHNGRTGIQQGQRHHIPDQTRPLGLHSNCPNSREKSLWNNLQRRNNCQTWSFSTRLQRHHTGSSSLSLSTVRGKIHRLHDDPPAETDRRNIRRVTLQILRCHVLRQQKVNQPSYHSDICHSLLTTNHALQNTHLLWHPRRNTHENQTKWTTICSWWPWMLVDFRCNSLDRQQWKTIHPNLRQNSWGTPLINYLIVFKLTNSLSLLLSFSGSSTTPMPIGPTSCHLHWNALLKNEADIRYTHSLF